MLYLGHLGQYIVEVLKEMLVLKNKLLWVSKLHKYPWGVHTPPPFLME